jgi:hypothetical protein
MEGSPLKWGQKRHHRISGEIERMNEVTIQAGLRPPLACDEGRPKKHARKIGEGIFPTQCGARPDVENSPLSEVGNIRNSRPRHEFELRRFSRIFAGLVACQAAIFGRCHEVT